MGSIASQITSITVVYSSVYSGADQRKHQSSASLAFMRGIHRRPVNSPHKGPVTRIMFHLMTSSWPRYPQSYVAYEMVLNIWIITYTINYTTVNSYIVPYEFIPGHESIYAYIYIHEYFFLYNHKHFCSPFCWSTLDLPTASRFIGGCRCTGTK